MFEEMDKKVKAGVSVEEIARWLQEDLMQLQDVKRETLVRQLYRYKSQFTARSDSHSPTAVFEEGD